MSKNIDPEKNNSKPKGRKPFLEFWIMNLTKYFLVLAT